MAAVITAKGRDTTTAFLTATGSPAVPKVIGWGTNPGAVTASATDIAIFKEAAESRVTGTTAQATTTTTNDTVSVTGTITSSSGQTVAEVAITDSTTKPASTTWATAPTGTSNAGGTTQTGTLTSATGLTSGVYIQDASGEVMCLTTISGTSVTAIVRAANGSTGVASTNGNQVTLGAIPGASVTGGNVYMHANFTGLALNSGDSIAFTLNTKYT